VQGFETRQHPFVTGGYGKQAGLVDGAAGLVFSGAKGLAGNAWRGAKGLAGNAWRGAQKPVGKALKTTALVGGAGGAYTAAPFAYRAIAGDDVFDPNKAMASGQGSAGETLAAPVAGTRWGAGPGEVFTGGGEYRNGNLPPIRLPVSAIPDPVKPPLEKEQGFRPWNATGNFFKTLFSSKPVRVTTHAPAPRPYMPPPLPSAPAAAAAPTGGGKRVGSYAKGTGLLLTGGALGAFPTAAYAQREGAAKARLAADYATAATLHGLRSRPWYERLYATADPGGYYGRAAGAQGRSVSDYFALLNKANPDARADFDYGTYVKNSLGGKYNIDSQPV
jgi:hypothetical protein